LLRFARNAPKRSLRGRSFVSEAVPYPDYFIAFPWNGREKGPTTARNPLPCGPEKGGEEGTSCNTLEHLFEFQCLLFQAELKGSCPTSLFEDLPNVFVLQEKDESISKRIHVSRFGEEGIVALLSVGSDPATVCGNHCRTRSHGLKRGKAKALVPGGKEEDRGFPVVSGKFILRGVEDDFEGKGDAVHLWADLTHPVDFKVGVDAPGLFKGLQGDIESFKAELRVSRKEYGVLALLFPWVVEVCINTIRHDRSFPAIPDPEDGVKERRNGDDGPGNGVVPLEELTHRRIGAEVLAISKEEFASLFEEHHRDRRFGEFFHLLKP